MVDLDEGADDIVTLRFLPPFADGDEQGYLDALQRVGSRERPYALLTVFGGAGALSQAGERAQALWYKATKARMNASCRALAIVRPGATPKMAETFQKLWTFEVSLQPDVPTARAVLLQRLREAA